MLFLSRVVHQQKDQTIVSGGYSEEAKNNGKFQKFVILKKWLWFLLRGDRLQEVKLRGFD